MTALELLAFITAALLLQVVAGAAFVVWRRPAAAGASPAAAEPGDTASTTGAWPGWRDFRVVRREFEDLAQTQCSFYLQPVDGVPLPPFLPGQYLTVRLKLLPDAAGATGAASSAGGPGAAGAVRTITRCYSLSDRPEPTGYRITVKRVPPPAAQPSIPPGLSSGHLHDRVQVGDVLQLKAPAGRFFIDPDATLPVVLVAGGIGITPLMSMLRGCLAVQPGRQVHLVYGVRCASDLAFKAVLDELAAAHPAFKLHVVFSRPEPGDMPAGRCRHVGHIDVALLRSVVPHGRHAFYVCGPQPMMQSLVPALREWGVQAGDLHFEAFGPASLQPASPLTQGQALLTAETFDVRFSRSGRTLAWDGRDTNLLDFAERNNLAVESGCRSGSCGACQTRLLEGSVAYAEQPGHDIAPGHCLLCCGKPQSDLVLQA